ncbi:hypothetical protein [Vibrio phage PJN101]|nr:hypothetical protein [Vibrio phage PJN101]
MSRFSLVMDPDYLRYPMAIVRINENNTYWNILLEDLDPYYSQLSERGFVGWRSGNLSQDALDAFKKPLFNFDTLEELKLELLLEN